MHYDIDLMTIKSAYPKIVITSMCFTFMFPPPPPPNYSQLRFSLLQDNQL